MNTRRYLIAIALLAAPAAAAFPTAAAAQGVKHTFFMRGSIVNVDGQGIVVCVGKIDGAQAGQVLNVYRNVYRPGRSGVNFTRTAIGTVRIRSSLNDHFSSASVLKGDVKVNDIVELERRVG